jgi:hypothetical protein
MPAMDASALPPALDPSRCSLAAIVVGLACFISSVILLIVGAALPGPLSLPLAIPGAVVNRVAAAPVVSSQDTLQSAGDPHVFFPAIDFKAADHGGGTAMTHDHLGAEPAARLSTSADNPSQTHRAATILAAELARGTRAESAHLATIEIRRDDPRALLLRTAAWNRERGRSNV